MNSLIKSILCMVSVLMIMLAVIVILQIKSENSGNSKCLAMEGYSEKIGIRGFDLPSEQQQPVLVNAVEAKEQLQIDIIQIAFIGLIAVGVLASVIIPVYWYKTARRGN
jgi:hypothetical protein